MFLVLEFIAKHTSGVVEVVLLDSAVVVVLLETTSEVVAEERTEVEVVGS